MALQGYTTGATHGKWVYAMNQTEYAMRVLVPSGKGTVALHVSQWIETIKAS
ncbi:hypothetical protein Holit_01088 [Hollandina sp. SP2]